jgi:hypothetical protein
MAEQAAQPEIHYEVLALHGERWLIDVVMRERDAALEEARHLLGRGEVAGVEVRKELYDPATGLAAGRIVFKRLKPKRPRPRFLAAPRPPPAAAAAQPAPEPEWRPRGSPGPSRAAGRDWLGPVGLTVLAGGFLAALLVAAVAVT